MRTFIAIDLSPEIKARLAALVERLAGLSRDIKWVRQDSMHLTLKFLGEVDDLRAARVEDLLQTIAPKYHPIPMTLKGTGTFPPGSKSPRVLWVGAEADPLLAAFQEEVEEGCEKLGFVREGRPFRPHLTLGRIKSQSALGPVLREFEQSRDESFGEMLVERLTFFQSRLRPGGAEYSILREFPLK